MIGIEINWDEEPSATHYVKSLCSIQSGFYEISGVKMFHRPSKSYEFRIDDYNKNLITVFSKA